MNEHEPISGPQPSTALITAILTLSALAGAVFIIGAVMGGTVVWFFTR